MGVIRFQGYEIETRRKKGCRRLILRAPRDGGPFTLTVPWGAGQQDIARFLTAHLGWLAEHAAPAAWTPRYEAGERHWVLGLLLTLGAEGVPTGVAFLNWRQRRLEELVRKSLPLMAARVGRQPASVSFRDMRTRWGSCTPGRGTIRLSTRLGCVPEECVLCVLCHELCHLLEANHSPAFYRELSRVCPDWPALQQHLKKAGFDPLPPLPQPGEDGA